MYGSIGMGLVSFIDRDKTFISDSENPTAQKLQESAHILKGHMKL